MAVCEGESSDGKGSSSAHLRTAKCAHHEAQQMMSSMSTFPAPDRYI